MNLILTFKGQKLKREIRDWDTVVESIFRHCEWPDDLSKDEIIADIKKNMKVTSYGFCYEGDQILRFDHDGYLLN